MSKRQLTKSTSKKDQAANKNVESITKAMPADEIKKKLETFLDRYKKIGPPSQQFSKWATDASKFLADRGLPNTHVVFYKPGYKALTKPPKKLSPDIAGCPIDKFIIEHKGFAPDSKEAFAARVIYNEHWIQKGTYEFALESAYKLGTAAAAFNLHTPTKKKQGQGKRKPSDVAEQLAAYLVETYPGVSATKLFCWIGVEVEEVSIDGDSIFCIQKKNPAEIQLLHSNGKSPKLRLRTFQDYVKRYKDSKKTKKNAK